MNLVILDGYTINPGDLSWEKLEKLCDNFTVYDSSASDKIVERMAGCEIMMTSKCQITREIMEQCPDLRFIGSTATGYNNIDIEAAAALGIAVANVPAYATDAVAQHTIALMLELANNVGIHNDSVQKGEWTSSEYFCYWKKPVMLLSGKSLGIIGYGSIGRKVAEIASALGMSINIYSRDSKAAQTSDFVSLHCPLTAENRGMINDEFLKGMKTGAVLINTARGALVDEKALAGALKSGKLSAAATDVLSTEPPTADCPLLAIENCIITPHMAWAPKEMRQLVIDVLADNLDSWLKGGLLNRVEG